jgi:hypothetical protein
MYYLDNLDGIVSPPQAAVETNNSSRSTSAPATPRRSAMSSLISSPTGKKGKYMCSCHRLHTMYSSLERSHLFTNWQEL